jgi:hypothetical protein
MVWIPLLMLFTLFSTNEALIRPDAQDVCFQQHCFGCSGEPCLLCKLQYCSAPTPTPVNVNGCNCNWISSDDCKKQDVCANSCRAANSWGPCGRGIVARQPVNAKGCDCSWIPNDDCIKHDQCAVNCRAVNSWGRCGGSVNNDVEPQKEAPVALQPLNETKGSVIQNEGQMDLLALSSRLDPSELICYQQHCFGCSGEQCLYCQQLYCTTPGGGSMTPEDVTGCSCSWIANDDCSKHDHCAVACRAKNPWGRCGNGVALSTNTAENLNLFAVGGRLDPSTLICYQQRCLGCSGEQCLYCQQLYCSGSGYDSRTPVNANGCNCNWILRDDCQKTDRCARTCRAANPWGRCGGYANSGVEAQKDESLALQPQMNFAVAKVMFTSTCFQENCFGCSGEQCLDCLQKTCGGSNSRKPVSVAGCDCSWVPNDDCRNTDYCATACRSENSWGPCGASVASKTILP